MDDKTSLRARDFWTSLILIALSLFFLHETAAIPFFDARSGGVDSAQWYDSAALAPYGVFAALLACGLGLLAVSVREGGAEAALSAAGLGLEGAEALRLGCVALILGLYIFGLVPRVDFVIASALLVTALIWGFHSGETVPMLTCAGAMTLAASYALVMHAPQAEWNRHDDDWVALAVWAALTAAMLLRAARRGPIDRVTRLTPVIAVAAPLILVCAMAFGFRQNVPARGGLIFKQIEYHWYVTLKPLRDR